MSRRKPPERRHRRGTADVGALEPAREVPPPPHPVGRRLLKSTVDAWHEFWRSDVAGMVGPGDLVVLRRYFQLVDERERHVRAMRAEPYVRGSTGQLVAHPAAREIASIDARLAPIERAFGMTPAGRLQLGITAGVAAKSIDELNRQLELFDEDDEDDPRLATVAAFAERAVIDAAVLDVDDPEVDG